MGETATVFFKKDNVSPVVELYSHWWGEEIDTPLAAAVEHARPRWDDEAYGTRMMISYMLSADLLDSAGWGLSASMYPTGGDGETRIVDFSNQRVSFPSGLFYSFGEYVRKFKK